MLDMIVPLAYIRQAMLVAIPCPAAQLQSM